MHPFFLTSSQYKEFPKVSGYILYMLSVAASILEWPFSGQSLLTYEHPQSMLDFRSRLSLIPFPSVSVSLPFSLSFFKRESALVCKRVKWQFVRHVYKGDYGMKLYALYFLRIHVGHMGKFLTDLNELWAYIHTPLLLVIQLRQLQQ